MYNPRSMLQTLPCPRCSVQNAVGQRFCGTCGERLQRNGRTISKRRAWLKPTTISWSTPSVNGGHSKSTGCLVLIVVFVLLLIGAEFGLTAYGYSQLQTDLQIQECSPKIDATAKSGVSAINRITGLNVEGLVVFKNPSFVPLYIPTINHEIAIEGKKCQSVIQTKTMAVAPNGTVSQPISLQISSHDLPELVLHPLANGGRIHIKIVSKLSLGGYSFTRTTQVQASVSKPLSSYMR